MAATMHDWTRAPGHSFHDFHNRWITHLTEALNDGPLPPDYYAETDQHMDRYAPDMLTLQMPGDGPAGIGPPTGYGTVAVAECPPKVSRTLSAPVPRRRVAVRHTSGDR